MPSYMSYLKQIAICDAKDDDIETWITVRGRHIPIMKGQSKEEAVKSAFKDTEKKGSGKSSSNSGSSKTPNSSQKSSNNAPKTTRGKVSDIKTFKKKLESKLGNKLKTLIKKYDNEADDLDDYEYEVDTAIVGMYPEYVETIRPLLEEKYGIKIKKGDFGEDTDSPFDYGESLASRFGGYTTIDDVLDILEQEALTQLADHNEEAEEYIKNGGAKKQPEKKEPTVAERLNEGGWDNYGKWKPISSGTHYYFRDEKNWAKRDYSYMYVPEDDNNLQNYGEIEEDTFERDFVTVRIYENGKVVAREKFDGSDTKRDNMNFAIDYVVNHFKNKKNKDVSQPKSKPKSEGEPTSKVYGVNNLKDGGRLEFWKNGIKYSASKDKDEIYIQGHHPYDNQEYYYAVSKDNGKKFGIFRDGKFVEMYLKREENADARDIAEELEKMNRNLSSKMSHN